MNELSPLQPSTNLMKFYETGKSTSERILAKLINNLTTGSYVKEVLNLDPPPLKLHLLEYVNNYVADTALMKKFYQVLIDYCSNVLLTFDKNIDGKKETHKVVDEQFLQMGNLSVLLTISNLVQFAQLLRIMEDYQCLTEKIEVENHETKRCIWLAVMDSGDKALQKKLRSLIEGLVNKTLGYDPLGTTGIRLAPVNNDRDWQQQVGVMKNMLDFNTKVKFKQLVPKDFK